MKRRATTRLTLRSNLTDRARRYRAQNNVTGPKRCVFCGSKSDLGVMHLDGNESHGEKANLAWGCRSCNGILSHAFKSIGAGRPTNQYNPSKGVPTFAQYAFAVSSHTRGSHDEGGAIIHATPRHKRIEYARRIADLKRERADERWNPWPFSSSATSARQTMPASARSAGALGIGERKRGTQTKATQYKGVSIFQSGDSYGTSLDSSTFDTMADAKRFVTAWAKRNPGIIARLKRAKVEKRTGKALKKFLNDARKKNPLIPPGAADAIAGYAGYSLAGDVVGPTARFLAKQAKNPKRRNPADASVAAYEEFHGKQPDEFVEVTERVHYHQHLSGAGELRKLIVAAVDGRHIVTLSQFKGALLAFNERKNQLFVKGGDQAVDLKDFGIDPRKAHELETLGRVQTIDYKTDKRHLGDEGGKATYRHKFRTTNEDGRHVTIRIARYPDLIYRVRDKALEFSGGSYEIIAEGIDR